MISKHQKHIWAFTVTDFTFFKTNFNKAITLDLLSLAQLSHSLLLFASSLSQLSLIKYLRYDSLLNKVIVLPVKWIFPNFFQPWWAGDKKSLWPIYHDRQQSITDIWVWRFRRSSILWLWQVNHRVSLARTNTKTFGVKSY